MQRNFFAAAIAACTVNACTSAKRGDIGRIIGTSSNESIDEVKPVGVALEDTKQVAAVGAKYE